MCGICSCHYKTYQLSLPGYLATQTNTQWLPVYTLANSTPEPDWCGTERETYSFSLLFSIGKTEKLLHQIWLGHQTTKNQILQLNTPWIYLCTIYALFISLKMSSRLPLSKRNLLTSPFTAVPLLRSILLSPCLGFSPWSKNCTKNKNFPVLMVHEACVGYSTQKVNLAE